jgi:hypothetical protein
MFDLLTQTAMADRDLLVKNNDLGDNFSKPREVNFSFETGERERGVCRVRQTVRVTERQKSER